MSRTEIAESPWAFPEKNEVIGRYATLVPLSLDHLDALWQVVSAAPDSFTYLRYGPFNEIEELKALLTDLSTRDDQPFWSVFAEDGTAQGWLSICDVYRTDGAFEIGSIWFSPSLQSSRSAREAIFLLMCLGMDTLHYERLVWRCQKQNHKSFQAAVNLGFEYEGTWRHAVLVDGNHRDVSWFSILRAEWPSRRSAFVKWLAEENFNTEKQQKARLQDFR